jgi:hypothetical protein
LEFAVPAGADAVIVHRPTPVVVTVAVPVVAPTWHGPTAPKVTPSPEFEEALTEKVLPYCTFGKLENVIVCGCVVEPAGSIVNDSDTEFAAS